jgi:hypothetical protein
MGAWIMAKLVGMFNNFRIGTKLFLGFAIVILISIALNFFNQGSLIHVETSYDEFSHISHSTILINNIETRACLQTLAELMIPLTYTLHESGMTEKLCVKHVAVWLHRPVRGRSAGSQSKAMPLLRERIDN